MKISRKVDDRPSFQFYPKDWMFYPEVRMLSLEARGLWIDLLCIMFYGNPRGTLTSNGQKLDSTDISRLIAEPIEKVKLLMGELEFRKTFEILPDGTKISRRMYNEHGIKAIAGKLGADSRWHGRGDSRGMRKHGSPSPSPSPSPTANTNTLNTEAIASVPKTPQAVFMESWGQLYKAETGHEYKADKKDFILVAGLVKKFSAEKVTEKAKLLYEFCRNRSAWFTKGGMADFTIGKLSSQWNGLIEGADKSGGKKFGVSQKEYDELSKRATE